MPKSVVLALLTALVALGLLTSYGVPPARAGSAHATATPRPPTATATATATATPTPTATATPTPTVTVRHYVFPVRSKGKIAYGAAHHDYPATDIFCPIGSTFVAVTDGVVDFVSSVDRWNPASNKPELRGGLSVAIIGDDGVRYYGSHLSAVVPGLVPGMRVTVGQTLGQTGRSGDARSTPPHLHFGISHPTTPDDWRTRRGEISPYRYLKAWARGEALTPQLP